MHLVMSALCIYSMLYYCMLVDMWTMWNQIYETQSKPVASVTENVSKAANNGGATAACIIALTSLLSQFSPDYLTPHSSSGLSFQLSCGLLSVDMVYCSVCLRLIMPCLQHKGCFFGSCWSLWDIIVAHWSAQDFQQSLASEPDFVFYIFIEGLHV